MDLVTIRHGRRLVTALCVLLLLAGCAGTPTSVDASSSAPLSTGATTAAGSPGEGPATETFTDPETENTGVSEEAQGGGGGVQVALPGLPIGGDAPPDPGDPTRRCAVVNWTGSPDLPPSEVNLTLTELAVVPADIYELSDGGCGGLGTCLDRPGVLTGGQCTVAVHQVAASPDGLGELSVTAGTISCTAQDTALCDQFQVDLAGNAELPGITWDDALTEWPGTNGGDGTTGEGTPDEGTGDQGTGGGEDGGTGGVPDPGDGATTTGGR